MMRLGIDYSKRTYGLDVFRAIAILIVVYGHTGKVSPMVAEAMPSMSLIDGVELFFVLSGFLIGSILIKEVNASSKFNFKSLLHFWTRRWFRTLPNYYLVLLLNFLFVTYGIINGNLEKITYKFLLFLQNFNSGFVGFFWESWSLSIEEWFYIFLPIILLICTRLFSIKKAILVSIIIMILGPIIYRMSMASVEVNKFWFDVSFRKVVLLRIDAIVYGVLAAWVKYYYPKFWSESRIWLFFIGLCLIILNVNISYDPLGFYAKVFSFSIIPFGAALLLSFADSFKSHKVEAIGRSFTHLSMISYSMYLINLGLIAQVIDKNFPPQNWTENVITYLVFWILLIVVSTLLYRFYEKPMTNLRDRFKPK